MDGRVVTKRTCITFQDIAVELHFVDLKLNYCTVKIKSVTFIPK